MKRQTADVAVVGAGAAGMLAAGTAAEFGAFVCLFERGPNQGRKLRITGKGRCNITNDCMPREVMENLPTNGKFLYSSLVAFPPSEVKTFFEALGVPLKTERGRRVFPVSDRASDIVDALVRYCARQGVETIFSRVLDVRRAADGTFLLETSTGEYYAKRVILCTGGLSYPLTGSTGDGYAFARRLGHTISEPRASLVPLLAESDYCARLQGLSLKNVTLTVNGGKGKPIFEELGEMLFTHYGVTGPLVLSASAHIRDWSSGPFTGRIDLKPGLDERKLDERICRDLRENANKDSLNAIRGLMPAKLVPVIAELAEIPEDEKANSITRVQRQALLHALKAFPLKFLGTRPVEEAVITSGGVNVREVNPKTMESRLVPGLFFAGEILDVDGYTGGYNLQIAWSTARAAGTYGGRMS